MTVKQRSTRRQARQIREAIKETDQKEKNIRLLGRTNFQFTPRIQTHIDGEKTPRAIEDPGSIMQKLMEWSQENSDVEGIWSWGDNRQWSMQDWNNTIFPSLLQFERLTWAEIYAQRTGGRHRHKKNHDMDLNIIAAEAFDRWFELGLDDHETLFRFKLGNDPRLWGFKIHNKFFIVWWDKKHKIYPVEVS
jgi:hypothetical protein